MIFNGRYEHKTFYLEFPVLNKKSYFLLALFQLLNKNQASSFFLFPRICTLQKQLKKYFILNENSNQQFTPQPIHIREPNMTLLNNVHKNNFDFLRLLFATFVIITHSWALTGMIEYENDWLAKLTHGQMTLSYIGVKGFFIISGYLIYQSQIRSKNIIDYYWKRALRIYPGLIGVLLLTVLLAVIPYPYGAEHYWKNPSVLNYLLNNLSIYKIQYSIDGLLQDNPVKGAINGSLWTIPYEVFYYIVLSALFFIPGGLKKYSVLFLFMLLINLYFYRDAKPWTFLYLDSKFVIELGVFFLSGSVLAAFDIQRSEYKTTLLIFAIVLFILSVKYLSFYIFQFFTLPLAVILFGSLSTRYLSDIGKKFGDISYGVYIYGYPVQQTLMHYFKLSPYKLMVSSILITFILGYCSWHLIEKRALKLKNFSLVSLFKHMLRRPKPLTEEEILPMQEVRIR